MTLALTSKEKLLIEARRLLWARGFSNVPVREISKAAGVDVALINRHFGSKRGLFETTIAEAIDAKPFPDMNERDLVPHCVRLFINTPKNDETPSFLRMLIMNADDREIGPLVRETHLGFLQNALEEIIGHKQRAALFMAAMIGFNFAEKSLQLEGIAPHESAAYQDQLEHILESALNFQDY